MLFVIRHPARTLLPLSAVLSLLCGPSPSAACAAYTQRLLERQNANRNHGGLQAGPHGGAAMPGAAEGGRSDGRQGAAPPRSKEHPSESISSFVAPSAAKPGETEKAGVSLALPPSRTSVTRGFASLRPRRVGPADPHLRLHRPCYRATAPPRR